MKYDPTSDSLAQEWQAQEHALAQERDSLPVAGEARAQQYRLLARVLREPMEIALPVDFARQVALRALRQQLDGALERQLLRAALWLFGLLALGSLYTQGASWLLRLQAFAPGWSGSSGWLWLLLACLGINWLGGRRHLHTGLP
jgi:hypothetical protein